MPTRPRGRRTALTWAEYDLSESTKGVVVVIAGSDRATRRRAARKRDASLLHFGAELRDARERGGLSLDALQDRTGVLRADLERLEQGDLSRFPDERSALVAVRRYAETLGLDATAMTATVGDRWRRVTEESKPALTGSTPVPPPAANAANAPPLALVKAGHTSRFPGDTSHLRAFTQTAEVPAVGARSVGAAAPEGLRFDRTDAVPVTTWQGPREPRPAPLVLRVAVWTTVVLLLVGGAGLAVHHWRPAWLAKIHLVAGSATAAGAHHRGAKASHPTTPPSKVTVTNSGPGTSTVTVRSASFAVVVAAQAPCWIRVTSPASFAPVFSATVPPGTTKTFASGNGRLTVELGASHVVMALQINGVDVPNWLFAPSSAPYVVNFRSATT
jgi:hypothetical protein